MFRLRMSSELQVVSGRVACWSNYDLVIRPPQHTAMSVPAQSLKSAGECHGRTGLLGQERKQPLFEKSGAKTSFMLGRGLCRRQRPWPSITKFFASFCSQKVAFLSSYPTGNPVEPVIA
jgi:hypothetical protein